MWFFNLYIHNAYTLQSFFLGENTHQIIIGASFMNNRFSPGETIQLEVTENFNGYRLDQWLSELLTEEVSRNRIQKWIKNGLVTGPYSSIKGSLKIQTGDIFTFTVPHPVMHDLTPEKMEIPIIFEDDYLAVIHKPYDIPVHPGPGDPKKTLINGLLHIWSDLPGQDPVRPGIVHRLDRLTEGLMIIAKTENAHRKLADLFSSRNIKKKYLAWLMAAPPEMEGRIEQPLRRNPIDRLKMTVHPSGREAITEYSVLESIDSRKGRRFTLVDLNILTGRTHQIRVHMAFSGCPVVGDPLYSRSSAQFSKFGMLLFAYNLTFTHPFTSETLNFLIEPPQRFLDFQRKCENY